MTDEKSQAPDEGGVSSFDPGAYEGPMQGIVKPVSRFGQRFLALIPVRYQDFAKRSFSIFIKRRVSGLAAEAAFWVVFSLPWLLVALVSGLAFISRFVADDPLEEVQEALQNIANQVLTPEAAEQYATPYINDFFSGSRPDLGIIGLVLAIWAGSRAVLTYVDAIMVINGEYGQRNYVRRRLLSVTLYVAAALITIIFVPLILIGPQTLGQWLDWPSWLVTIGYFVLSVAVGYIMIVSLFHYASKEKAPLTSTWQGALVAVVSCGLASVFLVVYIRRLFTQASVYGVLLTPIAFMIFAFVMSLMILYGAIYNAVHANRDIVKS